MKAAPLIEPHAPLYYTYPVSALKLGASLGNLYTFARLDPESNLLGLWASEDQWYCGRLKIQALVDQRPVPAVRTTFYPEGQACEYEQGPLRMRKFAWVPVGTAVERCVIWSVDLENRGPDPVRLVLRADATWPPIIDDDGLKRAEPEQQEKRVACQLREGRVLALTLPRGGGLPREARLFGMWGGEPAPVAYYFGQPGRSRLVWDLTVEPGSARRLTLVLLTSPDGESAVLEAWEGMPAPDELYRQTVENLRARLSWPRLVTPVASINRGFEWAKVNTLRTQSRYPAGYGFTNDPPQDILVVRDAAWYIFGNDFFDPEFSREMIDLVLREGLENTGMFTEFIRCADQPPTRDAYGLNINDDTPLFILALYHHAVATRDLAFARKVYPAVRRSANYILSQMQDDLVVCTSRETNVRGIAGWRNIIPAFNLTGAVTEINAECAAALRRAAELATWLGHAADAQRWVDAAERLKEAVNRRLVSEATGLYLLALHPEGELNDAVTADMVFPLLFDVAEEGVRRRVEERLLSPDFWTPYGARTVGGDQPEYDPDAGFQLLGGVWPNLTAWVAYAARRHHPHRVSEALAVIYRIAEVDRPSAFGHVVPGEFPERLHGETGVSRGMALSPWMPPTYLWLAISGLAGVEPTPDGMRAEPALGPGWTWLVLQGLPYGRERVTLVAWKGCLYVTREVQSPWPVEVYEEDCSPRLRVQPAEGSALAPGVDGQGEAVIRSPDGRVAGVALARAGEVTVFVAREAGATGADVALPVEVYLQGVAEAPVWRGGVRGGEAVRLVVHALTGRVVEEERLEAAPAGAMPRPAA